MHFETDILSTLTRLNEHKGTEKAERSLYAEIIFVQDSSVRKEHNFY